MEFLGEIATVGGVASGLENVFLRGEELIADDCNSTLSSSGILARREAETAETFNQKT